MREKILTIVIDAVHSLNNLLDNKAPIEQGENCSLYGASGVLDSLSLVSLIVAIEESIENELNVGLILADEKAMSQRKSPFATVRSLTDYIGSLIKQNEVAHA